MMPNYGRSHARCEAREREAYDGGRAQTVRDIVAWLRGAGADEVDLSYARLIEQTFVVVLVPVSAGAQEPGA